MLLPCPQLKHVLASTKGNARNANLKRLKIVRKIATTISTRFVFMVVRTVTRKNARNAKIKKS